MRDSSNFTNHGRIGNQKSLSQAIIEIVHSFIICLDSPPLKLDTNIPINVMIAVTMNARDMPVTNPADSVEVSDVYPPEIIPETTWYGMAVVIM